MARQRFDTDIIKERIKEMRKERKITQKELAEKTGLSINTIKSYECGRRIPDAYSTFLLADALKVSDRYIFDYESNLG